MNPAVQTKGRSKVDASPGESHRYRRGIGFILLPGGNARQRVLVAMSGLLFCFAASGQTSQSSTATQASPSTSQGTVAAQVQEYHQQRASLRQELRSLVSAGASKQQLIEWNQQHAARFELLQQQAGVLAMASASRPIPMGGSPNIPLDASQTLRDFLTTAAALEVARAQIRNGALQTLAASPGEAEVNQMQQKVIRVFHQQHAGDLLLQQQRARALAAESLGKPLVVPAAAVIPPGASAQMKAYLTARMQLAQERARLFNRYGNADAATREQAFSQWRQQNAGRMQELHKMAQQLSATWTAN